MNNNKNIIHFVSRILDIPGIGFVSAAIFSLVLPVLLIGHANLQISVLILFVYMAITTLLDSLVRRKRRKEFEAYLAEEDRKIREIKERLAEAHHTTELLFKDIENLRLQVQLLTVKIENSMLRIALIMSDCHQSRRPAYETSRVSLPSGTFIEGEYRVIPKETEK